jgi:hypothetical protein
MSYSLKVRDNDNLDYKDVEGSIFIAVNLHQLQTTFASGAENILLTYNSTNMHKSTINHGIPSNENFQFVLQVIKGLLRKFIEFLTELIYKLVQFVKYVINRTQNNAEQIEVNLNTIRTAQASRADILNTVISPAATYTQYRTFVDNVTKLTAEAEKFIRHYNVDDEIKLLLEETAEDDLPKTTSTSRRLTLVFKNELIALGESVGLTFPNLFTASEEDAIQSVNHSSYNSKFRELLTASEPSTLKELGYTFDIVQSLYQDDIRPLISAQSRLQNQGQVLETIKTRCELRLRDFEKNKQLLAKIEKLPNRQLNKIHMLSTTIAKLGALLVLNAKIIAIIDEVVTYHKILSRAIARGVTNE